MSGATAGILIVAGALVCPLNDAVIVPATVPGAIGGSEAVTPETGTLSHSGREQPCVEPALLATKPRAGSI